MTEIYGHRWVSSYGSTPNDSWVAALGEMPANELKTGLDTMLKECLQWPPTLTEFISFCRKPKVDPAHKLFALPKPCNIDREVGKKRSARLMQIMTDDSYWVIWRGIKALKANRKKLYSGMMKGKS